LSAIAVAAFAIALGLGPAAFGRPAGAQLDTPLDPARDRPSLDAVLGDLGVVDPMAKIEGDLRDAVESNAADEAAEGFVMVQAVRRLDLGRYSGFVHQFTWPAGEEVAVLKATLAEVREIAALPQVYAVSSADAGLTGVDPALPALPSEPPELMGPPPEPMAPDDLRELARAAAPWSDPDVARARAKVEAMDAGEAPVEGLAGTSVAAPDPEISTTSSDPAGTSAAAGPAADRAAPGPGGGDGWWDVRHGHAAMEAWAMGYRGEGVAVAVLDDAVDYAHPDLKGTWAVLPQGHPYGGWPQVFDPFVGFLAVQDKALTPEQAAQKSTRSARSGMIELYQESDIQERQVGERMAMTACFKPLLYRSAQERAVFGDEDCNYVVPATSKGGKVRFGHHPDTTLRGLGARPGVSAGEWAGVIVVDEGGAGVYDTVYVDLNNNRDFTDDKPNTKADPLAWRDLTSPPDGHPDLTGGLLYFIADGELPFPGSWVWGLEDDVPAPGTVVGLLYAAGGHGTLCASNILSQARVKVRPDQILEFRDLGGPPPSINHGMAPAAGLVSIGSVYASGRNLFAPGWRYAVFGHDVERDDDQIQVTSNSYGWSDDDIDNWDADSRLVDYYVRTFQPDTTFLYATGNGGPGYGTIVPPSPSVGIDVASSTQFGSTGAGSITDTTQITYGDIIPFSNKGPGSLGSTGPDVSADGANAAGGSPINGLGDGTRAMQTWGGTSRSTPVAAGATALVYQAFKSRHDRWPTWREARAILMSGARYNGYDTFSMGAGVVDAADAVRIAAGRHGVYATPSEWRPGGYRGTPYEAFANVVAPGEQARAQIKLTNPSDAPVTLRLSAMTPRRVGSYQEQFTTDLAEESGPGPVYDYLRLVDKNRIPAGTELLVARGVMPMEQFDLGTNYTADNSFSAALVQHTDIDGDGKLWDDRNGNGVVNYRAPGNALVEARWEDGGATLDAAQAANALGPRLPAEGLEGAFAWYGPACNVDGQAQRPAQEVRERIALVQQTTCGYPEAILNAQSEGAVAVVVVSDGRAKAAMGGSGTGITIPAVMVDRFPGQRLRDVLLAGTAVEGRITTVTYPRRKGIDNAIPLPFADSELDEFEFNAFANHSAARNNWHVSVHHPIERWADGIYLGLTHSGRNVAVPSTAITVRYDFYKYQPWQAVTLGQSTVTIPARGEAIVDATLTVPAGAPPGAWQGAIFADYDRGAGDTPVPAPGGYELEHLRTVIPVHAAIAPTYDWKGSFTLGGSAGADADAPYNNGAVRGTFNWGWRPESGDWRFFFFDATPPPVPNTFWIFRTRWEDSKERQSDIDTRVWGPLRDRYSDPTHPANQPDPEDPGTPAENRAAADWYGPHAIGLIGRSTYAHRGSGAYTFVTSTGSNEDWVAAPAGAGLHEVMLHNVLFSGAAVDLPFETTVGSLRVTTTDVRLYGQYCGTVEVVSEIAIPQAVARGFGLTVPEVLADQVAQQDPTMPNNPTQSSFKRDLPLTTEAANITVSLASERDDNLNLYVLYDGNRDGQFAYPGEVVGQSASNAVGAAERVALGPIQPAGAYQVWVYGVAVNGAGSTFDLTIDVMDERSLKVTPQAMILQPGQPVRVELCADMAKVGDQAPALYGRLLIGPSISPTLIQMPVTWARRVPTIHLPLSLSNEVVAAQP